VFLLIADSFRPLYRAFISFLSLPPVFGFAKTPPQEFKKQQQQQQQQELRCRW